MCFAWRVAWRLQAGKTFRIAGLCLSSESKWTERLCFASQKRQRSTCSNTNAFAGHVAVYSPNRPYRSYTCNPGNPGTVFGGPSRQSAKRHYARQYGCPAAGRQDRISDARPSPLIRPPLIRLPHLLTRSTSPAVSLPQFTRTTSPAVSLPQYLSRSISPAVSLPQYFSCSTSPAVPQPSREVHPQNNNQHDDDSAQRRIHVRAFGRLIRRSRRLVRQPFQLFA